MSFRTALRPLLAILYLGTLTNQVACESSSDEGGQLAYHNDEIASRSPLDLNDVSVLFPLPVAGHADDLLPLDSLLPRDIFDDVTMQLGNESYNPFLAYFDLIRQFYGGGLSGDAYDSFRIVAFRIDPCFSTPEGCSHQVRLVAQPLLPSESGAHPAGDAAIHLIYEIRYDLLSAIVHQLVQLESVFGRDTDGQPLGVNPIMLRQGLEGDYARALKGLIANFLDETNLRRVTYQANREGAVGFAGVNIVDGRAEPSNIPTLDVRTQWFETDGQFSPPSTLEHSPEGFFIGFDEATTAARDALFDRAFEIENPERNNALSMDCVGCHTAQLGRARHAWYAPSRPSPDEFRSPAGFVLKAPPTTGSPRAFGYHSTTPSVSQRVVNESAFVAEVLNGLIASHSFGL